MRYHVTPTLDVETQQVLSALALIEQREVAVVTSFDDARAVLRKLGMSEADIEARIQFAKTGKLPEGYPSSP